MVATRCFLNSQPDPSCPFCLRNGLIPSEKIVAKARWAYCVLEYSQAVPGTYQIVPRWHEMSATRWLRFLWSFFWLLRKLSLKGSFNISVNFGADAGQTLCHPHVWAIPRAGEFAGKGLAYFVALEAHVRRKKGMDLGALVKSHQN